MENVIKTQVYIAVRCREIRQIIKNDGIDVGLKHHRMQLPREIIVGSGALEQVPMIVRKLGFTKSALIVAGPKTNCIAGEKVKKLLEEKEGMTVSTYIVRTATVKDVENVEERIRKHNPQIVFGIGGGTKIDVAKCSSARRKIPFISVPTTASHDGIASPLSSIKGFKKPFSVMSQAPLAIIADTRIVMQAPWHFTISGCEDVIAKLTAVKDWELACEERNEYYGGYAASLALMSAKHVMQNIHLFKKENEEGLRILIEALISCGVSMSIAGSSRPCSGSEHLFSHAFDMLEPDRATHGEQCGIGTIMMAYLHGTNWRRIRDVLTKLGAPTNARDLGVENEVIPKALEVASGLRPERYTILNKLRLHRTAYEHLAKVTGII